MKHIRQQDLADWRKKHTPKKCPVLGIEDYLPVVDHDHKTGQIRGVISNQANVLIGKIENCFRSRCSATDLSLQETLRKVIRYLDKKQGPLHPVGLRQLTKRFDRMKVDEQKRILKDLRVSRKKISTAKNSKERTRLYRKALIDERK